LDNQLSLPGDGNRYIVKSQDLKADREIINKFTVGNFIDACVQNHAEAKRLLNLYPALRQATWLGSENLLNFLVIENFTDGVRFCLENRFDVNVPDEELGSTPLHYACKLNYLETAKVLLEYGANPNAMSALDDTPIHCCLCNANAEMIDLLISNGADPHYTTEQGETIFDNWPNNSEKQSRLVAVLQKHNVAKNLKRRGL